ncbi:MAG: hypothetical protein HY554_11465, partial [Elusimicrobia bacterium]|nr:hypothetical protein [Elusimicrobiota bacterium]
ALGAEPDAPRPASPLPAEIPAGLARGDGFDGSTPRRPPAPPSLFENAYGLYLWAGEHLPPDASQLRVARILALAEPLIGRGPAIAMLNGGRLVLLSAQDPARAPIAIALLSDEAPSSRVRALAEKLEAAAAADRRDGGFFNVLAIVKRLSAILSEPAAPEAKPKPARERPPLDPARQPREWLERALRDAMNAAEPFEALDLLRAARGRTRGLLNYQEGSAFLERLRAQAELLAAQYTPGLIEQAQFSAGNGDAEESDRFLGAAFEFAEYAPSWLARVNAAARRAQDTLRLLERLGSPDPRTGQAQPKPTDDAPPAASAR